MSVVATGVTNAGEERPLGRRACVLVVEDDWLISSLLAEELYNLGLQVIGPARSVAEALVLANDNPLDAALVDLSLGGVLAHDVINSLTKRGIPFVVVTAHTPVPAEMAGLPVLEKPFTGDALRQAIGTMLRDTPVEFQENI